MLFNNKVKYLTIKIEDQKMNLRSEKLQMTQGITMGLKRFYELNCHCIQKQPESRSNESKLGNKNQNKE